MNCRLPKKIGTPGGGTSYPDGAFIPVTKFTAGKSYALVAKIDGVYRYINTEKFNDYTLNATEVSVTPGGGYVTFGSEPALFKAEASGDGFTLSNGDNYLYGYSDQYSTALRYDASSSVWTADTSDTGGFESGKYLPKEVASSVWLKNASGDYEWSIKYESANLSFGYDRAGRDSTYSTGFVSFILYEKYEGGSGESGGGNGGLTLTIKEGSMGWPSGALTITANGTNYTEPTTLALASGTEITVKLGTNTSSITIWHNGVRVDNGASTERTYTFTLTEDTTIGAIESDIKVVITGSGGSSGGGGNSEEYAVTIKGYDSSYTPLLFEINGTQYKEDKTIAVAKGTTVKCTVTDTSKQFIVSYNSTTAYNDYGGTYSFVVEGNTTIDCSSSNVNYGYILNITTE